MATPEISISEINAKQAILLPELGSIAVQAFKVLNAQHRLPVLFREMSLGEAVDLLDRGEVGAVLAGAVNTTGEVIKTGINKFNPRRNELGEIDAKGQRKLVSSFFVFERHGDKPFIISDCAVNEEPEADELVQIAEQTVSNARLLDIDPHVAFLSYSTLGSGHGKSPHRVRTATKLFAEKYPDVPVIGEIQFDAATDEHIYRLKTGRSFPGSQEPNIFITPNLDMGNGIYKALQSPKFGGGWTAVGPLLQGFEGNKQLHDLSRGVTPESLAVICRYIARLASLPMPA